MGAAEKINVLTVAEHTHINEMNQKLNKRLKESQRGEGSGRGSLRSQILSSVAAEGYESAIEELDNYVADRAAFPGFQERASRYVRHCHDLIQAIQTKRNFPGLAALSLSKQQEIHEKVLEHFEELKHNLKHIEKVERENRLVDLRSTVWVVKTFSAWLGIIFCVALLLDIRAGILTELVKGTSHYLDVASSWFVSLIF